MPPVVVAAAAAAGTFASAFAFGVTIGSLSVFASAGILAGATFGLTLLQNTVFAPDVPDFNFEVEAGKTTLRASQVPRMMVFGETAVGGQLGLFAQNDSGASNNIVVAHAAHPVAGYRGWLINGDPLFVEDLDDAGQVRLGRFAGKLRIQGFLGGFDQAADPNLVAEVEGWTEDHTGGGVPYSSLLQDRDNDAWPQGFQNAQAIMAGILCFDPRDIGPAITTSTVQAVSVFVTDAPHGLQPGANVWIRGHDGAMVTIGGRSVPWRQKWHQVGAVPEPDQVTLIDEDGFPVALTTSGSGGTMSTMVWTDNWALNVRMYLTYRDTYDYPDDFIDDASTIASANISDEQVPLTPEEHGFTIESIAVTTVDTDQDAMVLQDNAQWQVARPVRVSSTGTLPAPLVAGTIYYVVPTAIKKDKKPGDRTFGALGFAGLGGLTVVDATALAASRADAFAGTKIAITSEGTGAHTLTDAGDRPLLGAQVDWRRGDVVRVRNEGGALPTPLVAGTDYYWIRHKQSHGYFAASLADARADIRIAITDAGTGDHFIERRSQLRYTVNGFLRLGGDPVRGLEGLMTAGAGAVPRVGRTRMIHAGAATASTGTLTNADLAAANLVEDRDLPRSEFFNAVRGDIVNPDKFYTNIGAPAYKNDTYRGEDFGKLVYHKMSLPFTDNNTAAQRLFKIALEISRQSITIQVLCKPRKIGSLIWDVEAVTLPQLLFTAKLFRIIDWAEQEDFAIRMIYREYAAGVYDWNLGEETTTDLAPNSSAPDPFDVLPPTGLVIAEELYATRDGAGVKSRAVLTWIASADPYVAARGRYEIFAQPAGGADVEYPTVLGTRSEIDDLAPGVFTFRIRAVNSIGKTSEFVAKTQEIRGLLGEPVEPQNLTIERLGGAAILRWDQSPDLDVRMGGNIYFRHSPLLTGATWPNSTSIGRAVPGTADSAVLPLIAGTYLAKARDSSRVFSIAAAAVSTKQATVIDYTNTDTLIESPTFAGAKTNVVVDGGKLKLDGGALVSTFPLISTIADWDSQGGVAPAGTYLFAGNFDFGSVVKRRLRKEIDVAIVNTLDLISSRTTLISAWEDFDGDGAASADAIVEYRETDDDPNGSPVWSDWRRVDSTEVEARAIDPRVRLISEDPAYNIEVSTLKLFADRIT